MKPGDLVRNTPQGSPLVGTRVGLVIDITHTKCWRTSEQGKRIDWDKVDPEPHAVVLYPNNSGTISIPIIDLEVVNEDR